MAKRRTKRRGSRALGDIPGDNLAREAQRLSGRGRCPEAKQLLSQAKRSSSSAVVSYAETIVGENCSARGMFGEVAPNPKRRLSLHRLLVKGQYAFDRFHTVIRPGHLVRTGTSMASPEGVVQRVLQRRGSAYVRVKLPNGRSKTLKANLTRTFGPARS